MKQSIQLDKTNLRRGASLRTKKHKCGDVREDGMVFWAYLKNLKSGEYWITLEKYEEKKATARRKYHQLYAPPKKLNRGFVGLDGRIFWSYTNYSKREACWIDSISFAKLNTKKWKQSQVGPDGKIFWCYKGGNRDIEYWVSKKVYSRLRKGTDDFRRGRTITHRPFKKGDVNSTGLVFLEYHKGCKDGQRWVTREQFDKTNISTIKRTKRWAEDNPEKRKAIVSKSRRKWYSKATDLQKIRINISTLIRQTFLLKGYRKTSKSQEILGCSFSFFKEWIESQFTNQMGWDNREAWHLDHYIPCSLATSKEELIALNHWSNMRPLATLENLLKNDTVPFLPAPLELTWVYDRISFPNKVGLSKQGA